MFSRWERLEHSKYLQKDQVDKGEDGENRRKRRKGADGIQSTGGEPQLRPGVHKPGHPLVSPAEF